MILEVWVEEAEPYGDTCTRFVDVEVKSYKYGENLEVESKVESKPYLSLGRQWRIGRIIHKKSGRALFVEYEKAEWTPDDPLEI